MNTAQTSAFKGKKVVITGTMQNMSRAEIKRSLLSFGASVPGSISKATDYLIVGEKAGSKLTKAESLGVAVLTEDTFIAICGGTATVPASNKVIEVKPTQKKTPKKKKSPKKLKPLIAADVVEPVEFPTDWKPILSADVFWALETIRGPLIDGGFPQMTWKLHRRDGGEWVPMDVAVNGFVRTVLSDGEFVWLLTQLVDGQTMEVLTFSGNKLVHRSPLDGDPHSLCHSNGLLCVQGNEKTHISTDRGASWRSMMMPFLGMYDTEPNRMRHVLSWPNGRWLGSNGRTRVTSTDGGESWSKLPDGEGTIHGFCLTGDGTAFYHSDNENRYVNLINGYGETEESIELSRACRDLLKPVVQAAGQLFARQRKTKGPGGLLSSNDGGRTWQLVLKEAPDGDLALHANQLYFKAYEALFTIPVSVFAEFKLSD